MRRLFAKAVVGVLLTLGVLLPGSAASADDRPIVLLVGARPLSEFAQVFDGFSQYRVITVPRRDLDDAVDSLRPHAVVITPRKGETRRTLTVDLQAVNALSPGSRVIFTTIRRTDREFSPRKRQSINRWIRYYAPYVDLARLGSGSDGAASLRVLLDTMP